MGYKAITGVFIGLSVYVLLVHRQSHALAAPSSPSNLEGAHHHNNARNRPVLRFLNRASNQQYPRLKPDSFGDFLDDDDLLEYSKRQTSDDYGHLRFGKRGEEAFDDYGHMRFGRSDNN